MSVGEEALGLGVSIAVADAFSEGMHRMGEAFHQFEDTIVHGEVTVGDAIEHIESGLQVFAAGSAIDGALAFLGNRATEEAFKIDELHDSVTALVGDAGEFADHLDDLARASGIFQGEDFQAAAKQLLGMGLSADRVDSALRSSAIAAAVLGTDIKTMAGNFYNLQFALESGLEPTRALRAFGVTLPDLLAQGIKMSKGKITSSMDEVMDAIGVVLKQRFGDRAADIAHNVQAMTVQIGEAVQDAFVAAGNAGLLEIKRRFLGGVLDVLRAGGKEVGQAFGEGLSLVGNLLAPIGRALKQVAIDTMEWLKAHPEVVKFGTAIAAMAGAVLLVVGGLAALGGVAELLPVIFSMVSTAVVGGVEAIGSAVAFAAGPLLGFAALAYILYEAWEQNIGGFRDTLQRWWSNAKLVVEGLVELFSSSSDGVGSIPVALQQKLMDAGLWPLVQKLYVWGERVVDVFEGAWGGVKATLNIVGGVLSTVVGGAVTWFEKFTHALGVFDFTNGKVLGGTKEASSMFKTLGEIIGIGAGLWLAYSAAAAGYEIVSKAITLATKAWIPVQWLLNAAMDANPLGLMVIIIAAVIAGIVVLIAYYDELARKSYELAKAIRGAFGLDTSAQDKLIKMYTMRIEHREQTGNTGLLSRLGLLPEESGGETVVPGGPSDEDRASAFTPAPAGGGGAAAPDYRELLAALQQKEATTINFNVDGKTIHQVVRDRDGSLRERDLGG